MTYCGQCGHDYPDKALKSHLLTLHGLNENPPGVKVSINLAIRNEEKMLPWTLSSVYALEPDEVIIGLDRCVDGSAGQQRDLHRHHPRRPEDSQRDNECNNR